MTSVLLACLLVGGLVLSARLAQSLARRDLPGVIFRAAAFEPTFHKFAGRTVRGFQIHVTNPARFRPFSATVAFLAAQMYQSLGAANDQVAHWTALIGLAWAFKPLWSPFVELVRSKLLPQGAQHTTVATIALIELPADLA